MKAINPNPLEFTKLGFASINKKLAIIIKMANMMNITNSNSIKDIACDVLGDTVILKTEVERDATLEISQAMSIAGDFKKVYGKNLQIL